MAIAFDNSTNLTLGTGDRNFNHTPTGIPRGVLVIIVDGVGTDQVVGVTYGGTAMTEVALSPSLLAGGEGGSVHAFFLGVSVPTGTQSVAINRNDATNYGAVCYTVTADSDTFVQDTSTSSSTSTTAPGATLTISKAAFVAGGLYSGSNNPGSTAGTNTQNDLTLDFGTDTGAIGRGTTIPTSDFSYTWSQSSDDGQSLVIAISEKVANGYGQANASIKASDIEGFGQANARIEARSSIGNTMNGASVTSVTTGTESFRAKDLYFIFYQSTVTISSVTDTAGNTWTRVNQATLPNGNTLGYAYTVATSTTTGTITINLSSSGTIAARWHSFQTDGAHSGFWKFISSKSGIGTSTTPDSGSITAVDSTDNNTLLIGVIGDSTTGGTPTSTSAGFKGSSSTTQGTISTFLYYAHQITNTNISGTITSDDWAAMVVEFSNVVTFGKGQAQALISGDYTSVTDTFTRNVSDGLGTADTGGDWTRITGTAADADVNGSAATFVTTNSQSYGLRRVLHPTSIEVKAQFSLDALPSSGNLQFGFRTHRGTPDVTNTGGLLQQISISSTGNLTGTVISSPTPPVAYTAGDTWNFKSHYYIIASSLKSVISVKLWKEGDTEPGWQVVNTNSGANPEDLGGGNFAVITVATTGAPTLTLDNLVVSQTWLFQPAQAQAKIFAVPSTQVYAQAQADIKQTYNAYAQSQADIKQTYNGYGQCQADIKQTYNGYGQAQACIIGWGFGQAQGDIKQTYRGYAQAQADIKQTYNAYAQSQADIKQIYQGYGQAQADIKQTYRGYAQAQADTKQTYQGYSQAKARINSGGALTYIIDTFTRTLSGTWGTPDYGPPYQQFTGDGVPAVDGSTGTVTDGIELFMYSPIATRNIDSQIDVIWESAVGPTSRYIALVGRSDTTITESYVEALFLEVNGSGFLTLFNSGSESLSIGIDPTSADTWYTLKFRISDNKAYAKFWQRATSEPEWQVEIVIDAPNLAGGAVVDIQGPTQTNYYHTRVDNYNVTEVLNLHPAQAQAQIKQTYQVYAQAQAHIKRKENAYSQAQAYILQPNVFAQAEAKISGFVTYARDRFERTETDQWGNAEVGGTWSHTDNTRYDVVGGKGTVTFTGSASDTASLTSVFARDVEFVVDVKFDTLPDLTSLFEAELQARRSGSNRYGIYVDFYGSGGGNNSKITIALERRSPFTDLVSPITVSGITTTINTDYTIKTRITGTNPVRIQAKVWEKGQTEPDWQIDYNDSAASRLQGAGYVALFTQPGGILGGYGTLVYSYDNLNATEPIYWYYGFGQAQAKIDAVVGAVTYDAYAQAQADIKQTYNAFAQAQANIKATYNVFGQAQADTKQTYNGHGQANCDIKQTYQAYAQAQADILQVYQAYAQAQADVKQTYQGYGQCQSDIKQVYSAFAQAQADIKATNNGYGQCQGDIKQIYQVYAQAQADIKQTYQAYAQCQADIKQTYIGCAQAQACIVGWAFAQCQADIKQTYQAYAQCQADIKQTYNGYGQCQADIKQTYNGYGQANCDIKQTYNVFAQAQADILQAYQGYGQAHCWIEQTYNGFGQSQGDIKQTYQGYGQCQADIKQTYNAFAQAQSYILVTDIEACGQAQADIKQTYQGYGQANCRIIAFGVNQFAQAQGTILFAGTAGYGQAQAKMNAFGFCQWGQAQGDIKATSNAYGQSQADIKQTYNAYAQAQADIKQTYNGYGQGNADIKQTYQGYGQAQACILGWGFGQSQADIKQTYQGYGQANCSILGAKQSYAQCQADIKTTYNAYGQSQSDIKQTYQSYGQCQADIRQTYQGYAQAMSCVKGNGFGQSQADIKSTYTVCGQSQADIKQTYIVCGQTQADIKTTSTVCGQANAAIVVLSQGYGQSNADIKATINRYGQANADILQTYNQYAQAQALIRRTVQGYGQVQARIKTTYQGYGQASCVITSGTAGFGNAQAQIQTTYNSYGQAQADILKLAGYGQANALILQPHSLKKLVISDSIRISLGLNDYETPTTLTISDGEITLEIDDYEY